MYISKNSGGKKIVAHSEIEPTIFKSKSLQSYSWAISTDSSNGSNLYFYTLAIFSSTDT